MRTFLFSCVFFLTLQNWALATSDAPAGLAAQISFYQEVYRGDFALAQERLGQVYDPSLMDLRDYIFQNPGVVVSPSDDVNGGLPLIFFPFEQWQEVYGEEPAAQGLLRVWKERIDGYRLFQQLTAALIFLRWAPSLLVAFLTPQAGK